MNLESVSMAYKTSMHMKKVMHVPLQEQMSLETTKGVYYQVLQQNNSEKAEPCETYNELIKNVKNSSCPYEYLADIKGNLEYNGITFQCDKEHHALCLGNMEETDNILTIPLTEGGVLKVNRRNIGELGRAIGFFSPQDIKRILQAIAIDTKVHSKKCEVEEQEKETFENLCDGEEDSI